LSSTGKRCVIENQHSQGKRKSGDEDRGANDALECTSHGFYL
jgi:hypothetical protein